MHGGSSPGGALGADNGNFRSGRYCAEAVELRQEVGALMGAWAKVAKDL